MIPTPPDLCQPVNSDKSWTPSSHFLYSFWSIPCFKGFAESPIRSAPPETRLRSLWEISWTQ